MTEFSTCKPYVLRLLGKKARLPEPLPVGFDYMRSGHIDSMGLIKFILEIEAEYGIALEEADLLHPAFRTIDGLVQCIDRKRSAEAQHANT